MPVYEAVIAVTMFVLGVYTLENSMNRSGLSIRLQFTFAVLTVALWSIGLHLIAN